MSCFDLSHAPVATATRAAATGLVSMSTWSDPDGSRTFEIAAGRLSRDNVTTVILVQPDRTAHLEREYVQLIGAGSVATFAGGPWGYGCT